MAGNDLQLQCCIMRKIARFLAAFSTLKEQKTLNVSLSHSSHFSPTHALWVHLGVYMGGIHWGHTWGTHGGFRLGAEIKSLPNSDWAFFAIMGPFYVNLLTRKHRL